MYTPFNIRIIIANIEDGEYYYSEYGDEYDYGDSEYYYDETNYVTENGKASLGYSTYWYSTYN